MGLDLGPQLVDPLEELLELLRLHLLVIAEGVEHEPQLNYLRKKKCNIVQGFYVGKPVPAYEFSSLLEAAAPLF